MGLDYKVRWRLVWENPFCCTLRDTPRYYNWRDYIFDWGFYEHHQFIRTFGLLIQRYKLWE